MDTLLLSVLKYLPDTVAGFDRFSPATTADENRQTKPPPQIKRALTGLGEVQASLSSTVARGQKKNECANESVMSMGTGLTFVQELLEPELAGLRAKKCPGPLAQVRRPRQTYFPGIVSVPPLQNFAPLALDLPVVNSNVLVIRLFCEKYQL